MKNMANEPALKYNNISAEEYLKQERAATEKHEYYQCEIFAMRGHQRNTMKYSPIFLATSLIN